MKQIIKSFIKFIFLKFGFQIQITPFNKPIYLWDNDEEFKFLMKEIENYTLLDRIRCFILYQFAKGAREINGDVAEIGVYKGGTARLISKVITGTTKTVHLFDTFSGMPPTDPINDVHKEGDFSDVSIDSVKKYLKDCNNVRFYQGFFPDTSNPITNIQFCFVHVDVDIYKSVLDCCEFFYPRLIKGGIMIFDDYGFLASSKTAVNKFFSNKIEYPYYLPTGQCFIVKF